MITPAYVQLMAAYNAEMNRRLYAAAARLSDDARRQDRGAFFGSIHATLSHLIWADRIWMSRFAGWPRPEGGIPGSTKLFDAFEPMRQARVVLDADITAWAATLDPAWLEGDLEWFSGGTGRQQRRAKGVVAVHMFNHQTHHRGQIHAMLTAAGEQTGDTDLAFILPPQTVSNAA
jgi:uncharacterized damage-inducible protein DinB